ncbi:MAG: hypothetical protein JNN11_04275 [Candidatus Doudnabacteria bacterium]|nr:hypothetical protein [Candidatus Doudnabacteria bacterium]
MKKTSAKQKIIFASLGWVFVSVGMVMYGFGFLAASNQKTVFNIQESKKELAALVEEKNSFTQAQKDLERLQNETLQPEEFFSRDITLVEELRVLESLQETLGVRLSVNGVSGTSKTGIKASAQSDIVSVPYSVAASGPYENIVRLVNTLENLPFVSSISGISLSVGEGDSVNLSLSASFYLRRN